MKKYMSGLIAPLLIISMLSGCVVTGEKSANLSVIYLVAAILSLVLLVSYSIFNKKTKWLLLLFSSVFVVNAGYTFLSVSDTLEMALWANRVSYLGSVFLPLSMMMAILNVTNTKYPKLLSPILLSISALVFFIAASPDILDIYYKEVSLEIIDGVSQLKKVYGILHPIYLIYLVGYFSAMVAVIIRAKINKTIDTTSHAVIIAIAVFVNIGVWLTEQFIDFDFEFLSISYIISELFLLGAHVVINENSKLREIIKERESISDKKISEPKNEIAVNVSSEAMQIFTNGLATLTPREKAIYEAYISRKTTKEIMTEHNITENTLKFHNKNLYGKLGVTSRKQLLEIHKAINISNAEN